VGNRIGGPGLNTPRRPRGPTRMPLSSGNRAPIVMYPVAVRISDFNRLSCLYGAAHQGDPLAAGTLAVKLSTTFRPS
jgi:hypothetical protein